MINICLGVVRSLPRNKTGDKEMNAEPTLKYTKVYDIRSSEMGPDYRLKTTSVARYFQECFAQYCTTKKLAAFHISKDHLKWVIVDTHMEFLAPMPFWSQNIQVEVWLSEVKKFRLYFDYRVFFEGTPIAQGDSCWYLLDGESRPTAVAPIAERFPLCNEKVFPQRQRTSFAPVGEKLAEQYHKVTFFDLDFNYHLNNLCYTAIAFNPLPAEYVKENDLKAYSVKYVKESFLNDELVCEIYREGNTLIHRLIRKQDQCEVCHLKSFWQPRPSGEIASLTPLEIK